MTSWKAFVPGMPEAGHRGDGSCHAGRGVAQSRVRRASGVIAYLLDGPEARYTVALPEPGRPLRAILETFTKAHSAVNHAQAFIDLACELRRRSICSRCVRWWCIPTVRSILAWAAGATMEKYDPDASREIWITPWPVLWPSRWRRRLSPRTQLCLRTRPPARDHRLVAPGALRHRPRLGGALPPGVAGSASPWRSAKIHLNDGRVISGEKAVADAHTQVPDPWITRAMSRNSVPWLARCWRLRCWKPSPPGPQIA